MTRTSLLALVGLFSAGLARGAPAPRPLVAAPGIELGATVAGAAFCDTAQRAVLALSSGDLVAIDATGVTTKLASLGHQVNTVHLACDRKDRLLALDGTTLSLVDGGAVSTQVGTFRYARVVQQLDDDTIAIVDADGIVWRWDGAQLSREWKAPLQPGMPPGRIAVRGDGKALVIASYNGGTIHNADGTQLSREWKAPLQPGMPPGRIAVRGDGKALVIASYNGGTIHNADGTQLATPGANAMTWYGKDLVYVHRAGLVRWTPGQSVDKTTILDAKVKGYQLASAGRRVIITASTSAEIRELDPAGAIVASAAMSRLPAGMKHFAFGASSFGVVAAGGHAHAFDLTRSSTVIDEQHPLEPPRALTFSPDGASLAMTGGDGDLLVAKVRNALVHRLVAPGKRAYGSHLVWASDGILTSGDGGYLQWDRKGDFSASTMFSLFGFTRAGEPIERDRQRGFIVHRRSGAAMLLLAPEIGEEAVQRIEIEGKHAVVRRGKHVELYRIDATDTLVKIAESHELRFALHVGLAGKTPRAFYVDDRKVYVLDASGDKELAILGGFATGIAVSKDRRRVAVANSAGGIAIFDGDTNKHVVGLLVDGMVTAMAFSPDGKRLAVASPMGVTIHPIR